MKEKYSFDEIRPYRDDEVQAVLSRVSAKPSFLKLVRYFFPDLGPRLIPEALNAITSVDQFQRTYIYLAVSKVMSSTVTEFSMEGLESIVRNRGYMFISNHRDIILDSTLLNFYLLRDGRRTCFTAMGDNLLVSPMVTDLFRINKAFIVHRTVERAKLYFYSHRLSTFIRQTVDAEELVWLAQRSGRTKDGDDKTQSGLIKMLNLSGEGNTFDNYRKLNIVPLAISYEYEPCDDAKAEEIWHLRNDLPYEKDDKEAMVKGIREPKGRVHMAFGHPLNEMLAGLSDELRVNELVKLICAYMDQEIYRLFRLWPNNYIAADLLDDTDRYAGHYSLQEKQKFLTHMRQRLKDRIGDPKGLGLVFLEIYAKPVHNRNSQTENECA